MYRGLKDNAVFFFFSFFSLPWQILLHWCSAVAELEPNRLKSITSSQRTFSSSTNSSSSLSALNLPDSNLATAVQCRVRRNSQDPLPAPAVLLEVVTTPQGTCSSLSPSSSRSAQVLVLLLSDSPRLMRTGVAEMHFWKCFFFFFKAAWLALAVTGWGAGSQTAGCSQCLSDMDEVMTASSWERGRGRALFRPLTGMLVPDREN